MVTALLGLSYPLFVEHINKMTDKYKTRHISDKFRSETAYRCFNVLIVVCVVELFLFPLVILVCHTEYCNQLLVCIQGICVFTLSMVVIRLYHLLMTYSDPFRFFNRIRANETDEHLIEDLQVLIQYASSSDDMDGLYHDAIRELMRLMLDFQQERLSSYPLNLTNDEA